MKLGSQIIALVAFITAIIGGSNAYAQTTEQDNKLDSLRRILNTATDVESELAALDAIAYNHYNADSTENYARRLISLAQDNGNKNYEAKGLDYLSWAIFYHGEYMRSCEYAYQAILIADSIGDQSLKANNYYLLGHACTRMQNQLKANEYFYKALDIYSTQRDSSHICDVLRNIAANNYEYAMYDAAEACLDKSITIDYLRNDKIGLSEDFYYLGRFTFKKFQTHQYEKPDYSICRKAKEHLKKAREYAMASGHGQAQMRACRQLAIVYSVFAETGYYTGATRRKILDSCSILFDEAYDICERSKNQNARFDIDYSYAYWLICNDQPDKAITVVDSLNNTIDENSDNYTNNLIKISLLKAKYNESIGDHEKGKYYYNLYNELSRNSKQADFVARTTQDMAQTSFDAQMRLREHDLETQRIIIISVVIVLLLAIAIIITTIAYYIKSRKLNLILDQKNVDLELQKTNIESQKKELEEQNTVIERANRALTDGINYASLIQKSVMPTPEQMNGIFGDNLVYYHPLHIVSGDFYWATQVGHLKMFAVGDCTGHGVPGAFLSMLGLSILNDMSTRIDENNLSAATMLDNMRRNIMKALHQNGEQNENHDGMDIALIIIDTHTLKMNYAGAYRPVVIIRNGEAIKLNPDRMPIGTHYRESDHFTDKFIELKYDDIIYLFSDGMTDQFGYDEKQEIHKYSDKRLVNLLTTIASLPFSQQMDAIDNEYRSWRSFNGMYHLYEQTDDAILVGLRMWDLED
ncbi:MAG: SpoIIE family protein phosphatase [Bacteroidales bacterium]|nr:SpoIIE family protein phosphatase [Bacteroidales bacterium]